MIYGDGKIEIALLTTSHDTEIVDFEGLKAKLDELSQLDTPPLFEHAKV